MKPSIKCTLTLLSGIITMLSACEFNYTHQEAPKNNSEKEDSLFKKIVELEREITNLKDTIANYRTLTKETKEPMKIREKKILQV